MDLITFHSKKATTHSHCEGVCSRRQLSDRYDSSEEKAIHDALTGVYDGWMLSAVPEEHISLSIHEGIDCSLAMIDVDRFKSINDSFGHAVGDDMLKSIVNRIRNETREYDKLVRYGGGEFILVMVATNLSRQ
ncbi:MAG: GGDEF domain-containing protein [Candidatus Thiodiazotropha sp.]